VGELANRLLASFSSCAKMMAANWQTQRNQLVAAKTLFLFATWFLFAT
jgi:hypothetical protein